MTARLTELQAKWHALLGKTLKLQVLVYIMGRTLTLPEDDDGARGVWGRESIRQRLRFPGGASYERETSPRMAAKEVKTAMSSLRWSMFVEVLTELEEMLRSRGSHTWGHSCSILLLLAMIFEDIQISIDIVVQYDDTLGWYKIDRAYARERCQDIDDKVCDIFFEIFHSKYKTRSKRGQGFNPLLYGNSASAHDHDLDSQTIWLVNEITHLRSAYGNALGHLEIVACVLIFDRDSYP